MSRPFAQASSDTPPAGELRELWDRCLPVTRDNEVCAWLDSLRIDPFSVATLDLGRVLPRKVAASPGARYGATS